MRGPIGVVVTMVVAVACAEGRSFVPVAPLPDAGPPVSRPDAGVRSQDASVTLPPDDVIREDFGNRALVESSSVAIVDVNHGWVTLPSSVFPALDDQGVRTLANKNTFNGLVAAGSIVVLDDATVEASDSIELRASDTVRVSGLIRAGTGGVHIVAGRAIYIDGTIESAGPIKIQLAGEDGEIELAGRLTTATQDTQGSAPISIEARGRVEISGSLLTGGGRQGDGGDVSVLAYGDVTLAGRTAMLAGGPSTGGVGGWVRIVTEGRVTVADGAVIEGGDAEVALGSRVSTAGSIELRGAAIDLLDRVRVEGGRAAAGVGGSVSMRSAGALSLGRGATILGGAGDVGGTLAFEARTATTAARARAGDGDQQAGRLLISMAGPLTVAEDSRFGAGDGLCSAGGDVVVLVAGPIHVTSLYSELVGGQGGVAVGSTCFGDHAGGSVRVVAHEVIGGPLQTIARGGGGVPPGVLGQNLDPTYRRVPPDIRARIDGFVMSRPIARPPTVIGLPPIVLELRAETPDGTTVLLELADADKTPLEWFAASTQTPLTALKSAASLRYRLRLGGRALDAPVVDGFDLHLGSRD